jgi:oligopeptide/dipeptide ABC transporter ATP-binding protein
MAGPELVSVRNVRKSFPVAGGVFRREVARLDVLNGVSLSIGEGEVVGLVGESGCGKSTLAKLLVRLVAPSAGEIVFAGRDVAAIRGKEKREFHRQVQMVFQDPFSSLNPRLKVRDLVGEMLRIRGVTKGEELRAVSAILGEVGLGDVALGKYPHEFSGGQRQRIAIARALVARPRLLIADEPVSALDLAIQSQILALLERIKEKYGLTILFISHDIEAVASFCDRAVVMYLGRIVESIPTGRLFSNGLHPYLRALIESMPVADPGRRGKRERILAGETPSPLHLPPGCLFHPRCPLRTDLCRETSPPLEERPGGDHLVACHHV